MNKDDFPVISIIVLNYNCISYLYNCFKSLEKLNYPKNKLEVIMADNYSTDGSIELVQEKFTWIKIVKYNENHGFSKGNNLVLKYCKGDFLAFLNPDTIVDPNWLMEIVIFSNKNIDFHIFGSKILFMEKENIIQSTGINLTPIGAGIDIGFGQIDKKFSKSIYRLAVTGASLIIKREVFEKLNGFDEDYFAYQEDLDLCWRAMLIGYKCIYIPTSIVYHKYGSIWGNRKSTRRIYYSQKNRLSNMLKNFEVSNLIKGLILSFLFDIYRIFNYLHKKEFYLIKSIIKADLDFLKELPLILKKRRNIQKNRIIKDSDLKKNGFILSLNSSIKEFKRLESI